MYASQDWRDYNIRCAFLNFAIAKHINKFKKTSSFDGNMMNEFFADYDSEIFRNIYNIPNVKKKTGNVFL